MSHPSFSNPNNAFGPPLIDNFNRRIDYLRLAVTDRCNLRCVYCMPAEGIPFMPRQQVLRYEEMERLVRIVAAMGVRKVRLTGGEPFVRKDLIHFIERLVTIPGVQQVHITTNGVLTRPYVSQLKELGIAGVNLSLDTLKPDRFQQIARRDALPAVLETFYALLEAEIPLKVNMVVFDHVNSDEIVPMAQLAKEYPIELRYIEQMPFDGGVGRSAEHFNYARILQTLQEAFPDMQPIDLPDSTARVFRVPGFKGRLGIIGGFSRVFCATCSRMRITAAGQLKTCLYDNGVLDLRALLRSGASDETIARAIREKILDRAADGYEAEQRARREAAASMAEIGG